MRFTNYKFYIVILCFMVSCSTMAVVQDNSKYRFITFRDFGQLVLPSVFPDISQYQQWKSPDSDKVYLLWMFLDPNKQITYALTFCASTRELICSEILMKNITNLHYIHDKGIPRDDPVTVMEAIEHLMKYDIPKPQKGNSL